MKKATICLMVIIMILGVSITSLGAESKNLNLQSAIDLALEQNLDLKIEKLNLKEAKLQYEKQKANNLLNNSRYNQLQAEYNLATAENMYKNVYDNLVKNTIQQYTGICLAGIDMEIKEKKVELEKILLKEANAQYNIGDISTIDLLEQENTYNDAQFNLETAGDDYQQSIKEFKTLLGFKNSEPILRVLKYPQIWDISEEDAIAKALKNSIEIELKNKKLELDKIDLERARVSASKLDKEIKGVTLAITVAEKDNTKEEISNLTQEVYYKFKQTVKNMNLKKERLAEAREKYELRKKQYDAGIITKTDVIQYEINMMESDYQYWLAVANYYLDEHSLRQIMNLKTGVFVNEDNEEK